MDPKLPFNMLGLKATGNQTSAPSRTTCAEPEFDNAIDELIKERGKVYGDPKESHTNIGLTWTALIQQHYGITLEHPIPPELVAQMMVCFKMQRAAKVFKDDNYDDAAAYLKFAREFQCPTVCGDPKTL